MRTHRTISGFGNLLLYLERIASALEDISREMRLAREKAGSGVRVERWER